MIVVLALGLALGIQAFLIKPYRIPSESMEPTLDVGQRVLVTRFLYHLRDPKIDDIVVFNPPSGAERGRQCGVRRNPDQACPEPTEGKAEVNFIKRIVAGPGDRLRIEDGTPVVNGERAVEDSTIPCEGQEECDLPEEITIPSGHWFMMGDNRGASDDSRFFGPVPEDNLIGKAFGTYWPPKRVGTL